MKAPRQVRDPFTTPSRDRRYRSRHADLGLNDLVGVSLLLAAALGGCTVYAR